MILHFDTPRIIFPFNFTALRGNARLFLPPPASPSSHPSSLSPCHNVVQVGSCGGWTGCTVPSNSSIFLGGGGFAHLLTLLCTTKVNYNSIRERERKSVGWGDSGGGRYLWRTLVAAQGQERSNNLILRVKLWLGLASVWLQKSFPSYWSSGFPPAREAHAPSNLCNYTGMYDSRFEKQSSRSYFQTFKWKSNHC